MSDRDWAEELAEELEHVNDAGYVCFFKSDIAKALRQVREEDVLTVLVEAANPLAKPCCVNTAEGIAKYIRTRGTR